ncbi:hypothetical protein Pcinc_039658 [Petrolisthes cinctipes]|uniref:Uncharacterized protein n=1 Tax=Petrolisthes cinctipes TaxID=88211 RepID=A0AAE1BNH2_PETCI|nr:hypothetical protein Pcinc_039658 [Petrolisthes cinctipes]
MCRAQDCMAILPPLPHPLSFFPTFLCPCHFPYYSPATSPTTPLPLPLLLPCHFPYYSPATSPTTPLPLPLQLSPATSPTTPLPLLLPNPQPLSLLISLLQSLAAPVTVPIYVSVYFSLPFLPLILSLLLSLLLSTLMPLPVPFSVLPIPATISVSLRPCPGPSYPVPSSAPYAVPVIMSSLVSCRCPLPLL